MRESVVKFRDDKTSFIYGEKEVYYLASVETKTHISEFYISQRKDAWDAAAFELTPGAETKGNISSYKVDQIKLFSKSNKTTPIVTVNLEYTYELCPFTASTTAPTAATHPQANFKNNLIDKFKHTIYLDDNLVAKETSRTANQKYGKLTLRKLWFEYESSTRGALSPYEFRYEGPNPVYDSQSQDRWGFYKKRFITCAAGADEYVDELENPYTRQFADQFENIADVDFKPQDWAIAWNLTDIITPSGSKLHVEYESDDYGYVQNRVATQMYSILAASDISDPAVIWDPNTFNHTDAADRRVYFKLESPIVRLTGDPTPLPSIDQYIEDIDQIYFKIKVFLKQDGNFEEDYVSGYAEIDEDGVKIDPTSGTVFYEGSTSYTKYNRGYITLRRPRNPSDNTQAMPYHPFAMAAWQHLRTNLSEYATNPGSISAPPGSTEGQKKAKARSLAAAFTQIRDMFTNYYATAERREWATHLSSNDHSYIRLASPDKRKLGGGCRVKKIELSDEWAHDGGPAIYGSTYEYTGTDDNGTVFSYGVAQYEPTVGGDENPLRSGKFYPESIPMKADNNLFFEYPINESYYPSPMVGYSKVVVKSLTTAQQEERIIKEGDLDPGNDTDGLPNTVAGTGMVMHEFYTARDYPVITDETFVNRDGLNFQVPIPLIGMISKHDLTMSQGYMIELNNMHGQIKQVSHFAQDLNAHIAEKPFSWVKYDYRSEEVVKDVREFLRLNNTVEVLTGDAQKESREMGVEYEFFTDMRFSKNRSTQGGAHINTDVLYFGFFSIPFPMPWPNMSRTTNDVHLAVANKVIHRTGILERVTAYDDGSVVRTDNLLYDAVTGKPLLTSVDNNFDEKIFSYEFPAHWYYDGMGSAYRNIGFKVDPVFAFHTEGNVLGLIAHSSSGVDDLTDFMTVGDEVILTASNGNKAKGHVVKLVKAVKAAYCSFDDGYPATAGSLMVVRSGRKNLLNIPAGSIVALNNPTIRVNDPPTNPVTCDLEFVKPVMTSVPRMEWEIVGTHEEPIYACEVKVTEKLIAAVHLFNTLTDPTTSLPATHPCENVNDCESNNGFNLDGLYTDYDNFATESTHILWTSNYVDWFRHALNVCKGFATGTPCDDVEFFHMKYETLPCTGNSFNMPYFNCCDPYDPDNDIPFFKSANFSNPDNLKGLNRKPFSDLSGQFQWTNPSIGAVRQMEIIGPFTTDCSALEADKRAVKVRMHLKKKNGTHCSNNLDVEIEAYITEAFCTPVTYDDESAEIIDYETVNDYGWVTYYDPVIDYQTCDPSFDIPLIDNVISANATKFTDSWPTTFGSMRFSNDQEAFGKLQSLNSPYRSLNASGQKGLWKPYETYVYVDERDQTISGSTVNVNLKVDGTYDNLPIFMWDNPAYTQCPAAANWRLINTITEYSPYNFELENKDILNIYSSAIYGYNGKLTVALAGNARTTEIGFESYEAYQPGGWVSPATNSSGNLDVGIASTGTNSKLKIYEYNVLSASANLAIIDVPYADFPTSLVSTQGVKINALGIPDGSLPYEDVLSRSTIEYAEESPDGNTTLQFSTGAPGFSDGNSSRCWVGKVYIPKNETVPSVSNYVCAVSSEMAHTGKNSLKVTGNPPILQQRDLKLTPGKQYVISGWIYTEMAKQFPPFILDAGATLFPVGIQVTDASSTYTFTAKGDAIDGWRKIEGVFTKTGTGNVGIKLMGFESPISNNYYVPVYYDDIRIQPFNSTMQAYVYDRINYRLLAVLDDNNYASLYGYDEQGNLFVVKKETDRGVSTLQESRTHIQEEN